PVPGERPCCHQLNWSLGAIETHNEVLPGEVNLQVFRLVYDLRTVCEGEDLHGTAAVVRVGKSAFDVHDAAIAAAVRELANLRQIGTEPQDEFPGRVDPLPADRADQSQQYRFVLEKLLNAACPHFGDEIFIDRCPNTLPGPCRLRDFSCFAPCRETLIERRGGQVRQVPKQRPPQARVCRRL